MHKIKNRERGHTRMKDVIDCDWLQGCVFLGKRFHVLYKRLEINLCDLEMYIFRLFPSGLDHFMHSKSA